MRILIAPNAMKGTISAFDFANAVEEGLLKSYNFDIEKIPVADGGDGTAEVLASVFNAKFVSCKCTDPLGRTIDSGFFLTETGIAIIEMATASGMKLLKSSEYNPMATSSFGTGLLIREAIGAGAKTILLGVGGSATIDAGMGALMALGFSFFNKSDEICNGNGASAGDVVYIETNEVNPKLKEINICILSDVENPLLGEFGAARVFAPQKGASPEEVKILEKNMALFAGALFQTTGKDISRIAKGGAAGGISASFHALLNAELLDGAQYILEKTKFYQKAAVCDLIITGEGKVDATSLSGKATGAILNHGMIIDKPVVVICGQSAILENKGFKKIIPIAEDDDLLITAMTDTRNLIVKRAEELGCLLKKEIK